MSLATTNASSLFYTFTHTGAPCCYHGSMPCVLLAPYHVVLLPQVPGCCVSCQPTTRMASTRLCRSPTCPTLASSATWWHGDPLDCPPGGTQQCWPSSSVRAGGCQQEEDIGFLCPQAAHQSSPHTYCCRADSHTKDNALHIANHSAVQHEFW